MSPSKSDMPKIDLSKQGVVHIAHCVIQAMQCEWEGCSITLNSWGTLAKHLLQHCSRVVQQDGTFQCSYSRCSGRFHNSLGALKTHVELSHLSRVALQCPARDCEEVFVRVQQLQSHFEHAHRELINKCVSAEALRPFALPAPPRRLRPPPPFPSHEMRMEGLLAPVSLPPIHRGRSQTLRPISRKWSRLNAQDDKSDEEPIAFDNLLSSRPRDISKPEIVYVEVQKKIPPTGQPLLSQPRPVIRPPVQPSPPQQSILYPRFVRMIDELVAAGTLAGHKEEGM